MAKIFRKPDPFPERCRVLLIGAPRSGTTLLATMIGRHTEVGMVNEDVRGIGRVLGKQVTGNKLCVPNQIRLTRQILFGRRWLKKLGIVAEAPKSKYCILDYLEMPNLKVIAIIRDGGDTVSSMMARGNSKLRRAARRWSEAIETIYLLTQQYGKRVIVVSFDELILSPVPTLQKVCQFLGITFQQQMLDGYKYNPFYPEAQLNPEKAHRRESGNQTDPQLEQILSTAYKKYNELLAQALSMPLHSKIQECSEAEDGLGN